MKANDPDFYKSIVLVGSDNPKDDIELFKATHRDHFPENSCLILGDGANLLKSQETKAALEGRIGPETRIDLWYHGDSTQKAIESTAPGIIGRFQNHVIREGYKKREEYSGQKWETHKAQLFDDDSGIKYTYEVLGLLKECFDANTLNAGEKMNANIWACYSGAAAKHTPSGVNAAFHSEKDSFSLVPFNIEGIKSGIEFHAQNTDFTDSVVHETIRSPETTVVSLNGEDKHTIRPTKKPLADDNSIRRCVESEINKFRSFASDGQESTNVNATDKILLDKSFNAEQYKENDFLRASLKGNTEKVKYYLEHGVNPDASLPNGLCAMSMAAVCKDKNKSSQVTQALLEAGANPNGIGGQYYCPLSIAISSGNQGTIDLLLDHPKIDVNSNFKSDTPLNFSICHDNEQVSRKLIAKGANTNGTENTTPPLLLAVQRCKGNQDMKNVVDTLLQKGADPNIGIKANGFTPLMEAAISGQKDVAGKLLENGAKVDLVAKNPGFPDKTAMDYAKDTKNDEMVKLIEEHEAKQQSVKPQLQRQNSCVDMVKKPAESTNTAVSTLSQEDKGEIDKIKRDMKGVTKEQKDTNKTLSQPTPNTKQTDQGKSIF